MSTELRLDGVVLNVVEVVLEVAVGVGVAVCKVDGVSVVSEGHRPCERVIPTIGLAHRVPASKHVTT